MAVFERDPTIRTGIPALSGQRIRVQQKATGIKRVSNPVLNYQIGSGFRATQIGAKPPFDIEAIRNAYLVDGYIRQGIDKYTEILIKEGWKLEGAPEPVKYLQKRLELMAISSGEPWDLTFERAISDFVRYNNCFFVIVRTTRQDPLPGLNLKSLFGKTPIGAYFNLPTHQMLPELDENGNILSWIQQVSNRKKIFKPADVLHFSCGKEAGGIWGIPPIVSVIEDIRALRQAEENVLKLIYKHLNPLIHQQTPDITGTMEGRQEDIDDVIRNFQTTAPDGFIVTPPGHKIQIVGAESQALRAEGYLKLFKQRVFSGLGVSELVMGENVGAPAGTADALTAQMHNRAKMYQKILSHYVTTYIFNELLMEGGFDPWNNSRDKVTLAWNEIEIERQIKEQTHAMNLWTMNMISSKEARELIGMSTLPSWKEFYSHRVQIPQLVASKIGMDPLDMADGEIKSLLTAQSPAGKPPTKSVSKTGKQASNTISPSNKTSGPRAKSNAPTAHKLSASDFSLSINSFSKLSEKIVSAIPDIKEGKITAEDLLPLFAEEGYTSYLLPICKAIVRDVLNNEETTAYARVNARLLNERAMLMTIMEGT